MILTIDQGTTSSRALVIDAQGQVLGISQKEFEQIYPKPGWVEHDPMEIWETTLEVCKDVISKVLNDGKAKPNDFKGIAITNQRETTVLWNKKTGKPVHSAIVWQCRRTADLCAKLKEKAAFASHVRNSTGLLVDSYFSGPKIAWLLQSSKVKDEIKNNIDDILFGTIDTWLLWKLTEQSDDGPWHFTEPSNASRTMLYDINNDKWDNAILNSLGVPKNILPTVVASKGHFGNTSLFKDILFKDLEIKAMLGDQQAAYYGHRMDTANAAKITYGTGTFVLVSNPDASMTKGLLTSTAFKSANKKFVTEGSIFIGGAIVQWLRDELEFISNSKEIESLANSVEDNGGVYLVPALAGLGAPFWKENARGTIFGISRGTNRGHIARAALESIAFRVKDVFRQLENENPDLKIDYINVDGGASKNDFLMQFQADLLGKEIRRYDEAEVTALGAARMTGDVDYKMNPEKIFKPQQDLSHRYEEWSKYLSLLL